MTAVPGLGSLTGRGGSGAGLGFRASRVPVGKNYAMGAGFNKMFRIGDSVVKPQFQVLSLCDHSGAWSAPWESAGYSVCRVDLQDGADVRLIPYLEHAPSVILAAPPCDHFSVSGARWWASKGPTALFDGLAVVDACLRAVALYRPRIWALENPAGRLSQYLGPAVATFDPADYGDPYTKLTCLWGEFTMPQKNPVPATEGSKMHKIGPSPERKNLRSVTPVGFAAKFYRANAWQVERPLSGAA